MNIETNLQHNLKTVHEGKPVYIAIIGVKGKKASIFFDYADVKKAVSEHDGQSDVYMALNQISDQYINNKTGRQFLQNIDVVKYRYFFVDIDPCRLGSNKKCSATDEESKAAYNIAETVKAYLSKQGFTEPIVSFSGNGYHLLYRVDVEVSEETTEVFKRALKVLADKFNTDKVIIDTVVYNPARLTKLYGTMACKGENTTERPHRRSGILSVPEALETTDFEKIEALSKLEVKQAKKSSCKEFSSGFDDDKDPQKSIVDNICRHAVLFKSRNDGANYISVRKPVDNDSFMEETYRIKETRLTEYLVAELYSKTGEYSSKNSWEMYIDTLSALATKGGQEKYANMRIARFNGEIFYDLCNKDNQLVRVSPQGINMIDRFTNGSETPKLIRKKMMTSQVVPKEGANVDLFTMLGKYLHMADSDKKLLITTIISWFISDVPKVILQLSGEQGSGKTILTKLIQELVDPANREPVDLPDGMKDIGAILASQYLLTFDNICRIKKNIGDVLCKVSTGGAIMTRQLYSNDEANVVSFKNCIILNGISDLTAAPDLKQRIVRINLEKFSDCRRTEEDIFTSFQKDKPFILYEIFAVLQKVLAGRKFTPTEDMDRMTDFECWGRAISEALFGDAQVFIDAYADNKKEQKYDVLDNAVGEILYQYTENNIDTEETFKNTSVLWKLLTARAGEQGIDIKDKGLWPKTASTFGKELRLIAEPMRYIGVDISFKRGKTRTVTVKKLLGKTVERVITTC